MSMAAEVSGDHRFNRCLPATCTWLHYCSSVWGKHPICSVGVLVYCRNVNQDTAFQTEALASAPLQRQPNLRQRILVVDDDPLIRRFNSKVLMYSCYQVDAAENGAAAWNALL